MLVLMGTKRIVFDNLVERVWLGHPGVTLEKAEAE
jgi:hypothetical protein